MPGTAGFRVWGYGTADTLEEVLQQGYFEAARGILCPGELVYVSIYPASRTGEPEAEMVRVALVMARRGERGSASVRLVQDFGGPDAPPTGLPLVPVKRGRGRPPGSRNKKPGSTESAQPDSGGSAEKRGILHAQE